MSHVAELLNLFDKQRKEEDDLCSDVYGELETIVSNAIYGTVELHEDVVAVLSNSVACVVLDALRATRCELSE